MRNPDHSQSCVSAQRCRALDEAPPPPSLHPAAPACSGRPGCSPKGLCGRVVDGCISHPIPLDVSVPWIWRSFDNSKWKCEVPRFPRGAGSSLLCSSTFKNPTRRGLLGTDGPKSPSLTRAASQTPLAALTGVSSGSARPPFACSGFRPCWSILCIFPTHTHQTPCFDNTPTKKQLIHLVQWHYPNADVLSFGIVSH